MKSESQCLDRIQVSIKRVCIHPSYQTTRSYICESPPTPSSSAQSIKTHSQPYKYHAHPIPTTNIQQTNIQQTNKQKQLPEKAPNAKNRSTLATYTLPFLVSNQTRLQKQSWLFFPPVANLYLQEFLVCVEVRAKSGWDRMGLDGMDGYQRGWKREEGERGREGFLVLLLSYLTR